MNGKTLFELKRTSPRALSITAELFTASGHLVKCENDNVRSYLAATGAIVIGGLTMQGSSFNGLRIGILLKSDGSIAIGVN
jgi:hypothetical protein